MKLEDVPIGEFLTFEYDELPPELQDKGVEALWGQIISPGEAHDGASMDQLGVVQTAIAREWVFVKFNLGGDGSHVCAMPPDREVYFRPHDPNKKAWADLYRIESNGDDRLQESKTFREAVIIARDWAKTNPNDTFAIIEQEEEEEPCIVFSTLDGKVAFALREDRPLQPDQIQALKDVAEE